jgi:DNA polymerase-3 subunit beta
MKLKIQKNLIERVIINMQHFLEKRDATLITSHIYIEANRGITTIKATDREIGLEIKIDNFEIVKDGKTTANGKKLLDIIKILKNEDEITLEAIEDYLYIYQDRSKFKLSTFNPEKFPKFPNTDNKAKIEIDSTKIIQGLKYILPSIDSNNPKFQLNGALIDIKKEHTNIVGTDTKRLSIFQIENRAEKEISIIIPKKASMEIQKIFNQNIEFFYDKTDIILKQNNIYMFSRLINGDYPDYNRVVPKEFKTQIKLPKKEFIEAIKMISSISTEIQILFKKESIIIQSISPTNTEAKTEIPIKTPLEEFILNANSRYILDFLNQIEGDYFKIGLNENIKPFVLKDKQFITVIMPIIV